MNEYNLDAMTWTREPQTWNAHGSHAVAWTSSAESDFWRHTGGVAPKHDGNGLLAAVSGGDFAFEATLMGLLSDPYDQFGVLVQIDEQHWIKCGIELDGGLWLSSVATRGQSDWARERAHSAMTTLRVTRRTDTLRVFTWEDGAWRMLRELTFTGDARVGVYSCSPKGTGFATMARFTQFAERDE